MSVGEPATPAAADVPEDGRETAAGPRPGPGDDAPRGDIEGGDIESGDVEGGGDEDSEPPLPPIPDALLGPLFDSAGEALRRLPPVELPPAARPLRAFDRRGLATPTARHQLRRLLDGDEGILAAARTLLLARPEAARLATAWREAVAAGGDACLDLVSDTAAEGRLPLLASVLTAALPDGVEFGLGLVVAMAAAGERETEGANAVRAAVAGQASAEEAHRRADAARSSAEAEVARLETALKEERRARRAREQEADETTAGTEARRAELEKALVEAGKELTAAQRRLLAAERRVADAEQRAADAEQRAADAAGQTASAERRAASAEERAAAAEARTGAPLGSRAVAAPASGALTAGATATGEPPWPEPRPGGLSRTDDDRITLGQIARAAEDLAAGLRRLADGPSPAADPARDPEPLRRRPAPPPPPPPPGNAGRTPPTAAGPGGPPARSPAPPAGFRSEGGRRRTPVRVPPGMVGDDPAAVAAMVRTPGVAVIVDGYNVSMLAWPEASVADQRERLCDALAEFQLRTRCEVTVVFDGAEVPGVRPLRRRGLRVVFSAAGQEADDVVVGEVMFRPAEIPVIVVSSDREVRARAEAEGATVLSANTFLQLIRR